MDILRKIFEEINQIYSKEQLSPYRPKSQNKVNPSPYKSKNKDGSGQDSQEQQGQSENENSDIEKINKRFEERLKNNNNTTQQVVREFDDHLEDMQEDWDKNTIKDILKGAKEWERSHPPVDYDSEKDGSGGAGDFRARANDFLNEKILSPALVREIIGKLKRYKSKLAEEIRQKKSPLRHKHSARAHSNVLGGNKIKVRKENENCAILIMAIDSSGSMWSPDLITKAYSVMNQISKAFTVKENPEDPDGIVLAFTYDTQIAGSPKYREWKYFTEKDMARQITSNKKKEKENSAMNYYGGGGNDFNHVLSELDNDFVVEEKDGEKTKHFFQLDPKSALFTGADNENPGGLSISTAIKELLPNEPKTKNVIRKHERGSGSENTSDMSAAPFMIVFTDGYEYTNVNISSSRLFKNNQANILYALAGTGSGVTAKYISPKNYVVLTGPLNKD